MMGLWRAPRSELGAVEEMATGVGVAESRGEVSCETAR
jgi:hypothetical protein